MGTYMHILLPGVELGPLVHIHAASIAADGHGKHHSHL